MSGAALVAVDVGTGSARAGVFGPDGRMLGRAERPIALHRPMPDHAEQSSDDIWSAVENNEEPSVHRHAEYNEGRRRRGLDPIEY